MKPSTKKLLFEYLVWFLIGYTIWDIIINTIYNNNICSKGLYYSI